MAFWASGARQTSSLVTNGGSKFRTSHTVFIFHIKLMQSVTCPTTQGICRMQCCYIFLLYLTWTIVESTPLGSLLVLLTARGLIRISLATIRANYWIDPLGPERQSRYIVVPNISCSRLIPISRARLDLLAKGAFMLLCHRQNQAWASSWRRIFARVNLNHMFLLSETLVFYSQQAAVESYR